MKSYYFIISVMILVRPICSIEEQELHKHKSESLSVEQCRKEIRQILYHHFYESLQSTYQMQQTEQFKAILVDIPYNQETSNEIAQVFEQYSLQPHEWLSTEECTDGATPFLVAVAETAFCESPGCFKTGTEILKWMLQRAPLSSDVTEANNLMLSGLMGYLGETFGSIIHPGYLFNLAEIAVIIQENIQRNISS